MLIGVFVSSLAAYAFAKIRFKGKNILLVEKEVTTTNEGTLENPYKISDVMASKTDATGVWIEGYVVGWVSGMNWSSGATFDNAPNADYNNTNCILADTSDVTSTSASIPAGIKAGDTRDILGLKNNPDIYKKHVRVYGDVTKYFGLRGVKNISKVTILD